MTPVRRLRQAIVGRVLERVFSGGQRHQRRYQRLHELAIRGMNFGGGADFRASGELPLLNRVAAELPAGSPVTVFDVGANRGAYAQAVLGAFGARPGLTLHAFEPAASSFAALEAALRDPVAAGRCVLHKCALGASRGSIDLHSDSEASGLASVYHRRLDHFAIAMNHKETVEVRTIDDVVLEAGIGQIGFLKMDVEGHELAVLKGAQKTLDAGKIRRIQWEMGGCNIDSRTFFQDFWYLLRPRYRIYRIVKDGLHLISEYRETDEVFVTVNYYAELG